MDISDKKIYYEITEGEEKWANDEGLERKKRGETGKKMRN